MNELFEASWRVYPSAMMMAAGTAVFVHGMRGFATAAHMPAMHHGKALRFVTAFRVSVIGLAIVSLGAAWMWQVAWLAILALIIGGEETFESTLMVYGLTRGPTLRLLP